VLGTLVFGKLSYCQRTFPKVSAIYLIDRKHAS